MCPIQLLLIHALRHGMIKNANSITEAMAHAHARQDKTIQWANPDMLVFPVISYGVLDFSHPAPASQLNHTVKEMCQAAGLDIHYISHNIRCGQAPDLMNILEEIRGSGAATSTVKASGHSHENLNAGTANMHVGSIGVDLHAATANDASPGDLISNMRGLVKGPVAKNSKASSAEMIQYCQEHDTTADDPQTRKHVSKSLDKEKLAKQVQKAKSGSTAPKNVREQTTSPAVRGTSKPNARLPGKRSRSSDLDMPPNEVEKDSDDVGPICDLLFSNDAVNIVDNASFTDDMAQDPLCHGVLQTKIK